MNLVEQTVLSEQLTKNQVFSNMTDDLKAKMADNKEQLDATMASVDLNTTAQLVQEDQKNIEVANLEEDVNAALAEIQANEKDEKLKEALMLQGKAAQFILTLKDQLKESNERNQELVQTADTNQANMLTVLNAYEQQQENVHQHFNVDINNRLQLTKLVAANPPPVYDNSRHFGTACGLLAFLNEDLEDYFLDICVYSNAEKCRLLLKTFGEKSDEYKRTTRRFFQQVEIDQLIKDQDTQMCTVYKELVHYMFAEKPKGEVGTRKQAESLTNYLERWFTIKSYCGVPDRKQGKSIMNTIFAKPTIKN